MVVIRSPLASAFLATIAVAGCSGDATPETASAQPANVELITVDTVTVDLPLNLSGQLYVEHDAYVYARTTGIVESVYVDLGSRVRKGRVLAQLEDIDQRIALAQAEAALKRASREVERIRELANTGAVARADSEQAELNYRQAELAQRQGKRNLELTRVVSPFNGVVTARAVRPGRLIPAGDSLFRVSALAPLRVLVHVPERGAAALEQGGEVEVLGLVGGVARAAVIRVSPIIDAASGTREAIVQLERESGMMPGASVTVRIGSDRRQVLAIPPEAIAEQGYVLVWENDRTALRAVTLGPPLPDGRLEVLSGLAPGEQVVRASP